MPGTLPPIIPGSSSMAGPPTTSAGGTPRAQDFSVTKLQQHRDHDAAVVSAAQVMDRSGANVKSTSVTHPGGVGQKASTSATHGAKETEVEGSEAAYNEQRDEKRRDFARSKILEKKREERKSQHSEVTKTLSGDKQKGAREFMGGMIEKYGTTKRIGARYDPKTRTKMRMEIDRARRKGTFTAGDAKQMKALVDRIE